MQCYAPVASVQPTTFIQTYRFLIFHKCVRSSFEFSIILYLVREGITGIIRSIQTNFLTLGCYLPKKRSDLRSARTNTLYSSFKDSGTTFNL